MIVWLRSCLFNGLFYLWTGSLLILCSPLLLVSRRGLLWVMHWWAGSVMLMLRVIVGLDYRLVGWERVPAGPVIFAAKHQSAWDTIIFMWLCRDPVYVLKQELRRLPIYGWFCIRSGMILVDRAGGGRALKAMVTAAQAAVAEARPVVIFPQGTRFSPDGKYHPGVYALARNLALPTVPVALNSGLFWGARQSFIKRPGVITLSFLEPLPPTLARNEYLERLASVVETASAALVEAR